jgi:hypothetical protein
MSSPISDFEAVADVQEHASYLQCHGWNLVRFLCSALLAARARGALGAGQNLFCQTCKASCFGFGGSSTAFTVIASIA